MAQSRRNQPDKQKRENQTFAARGWQCANFLNIATQSSDDHLHRVRRICRTLPETTERLSHGAPTFFARKSVYAMFVANHHNDGHIAVWIPAPPGHQEMLISTHPRTYFRPPYVGVKGWIGIELDAISDDELIEHLHQAWQMITSKKPAPKKRRATRSG